MSLPRMRITVGQMLIVVVVLALNCGILRHLHESVDSLHPRRLYFLGHAPAFESMELFLPRFLPLINLALIGILVLVIRRLGAARRGSVLESGSTSVWKGVVFFSLHFLVLGAVVGLFLSGVTERPVPDPKLPFGPYTNHWAICEFLTSGEGMETWRLFQILIAGLVFSGPFLLLSWIGGALAGRCASTLPRRRFLVLAGLVSLGFAMVSLSLGLTPRPFHEEKSVELDLVVVDKDSGRPIASAFVRLIDPFPRMFEASPTPLCDFTGPVGRVTFTDRFEAVGQSHAFRTMGLFSPWGRWLEVSADRYQTLRIPLTDVVDPVADLENPSTRQVKLVRGRTADNPCEDLAALYHSYWILGGGGFKILPDGRFFWYVRNCSEIQGREFGYVERTCDDIEFVTIPHPGEDRSWECTTRWRVIEWDNQRILSPSDDRFFQRFCRACLAPRVNPQLAVFGWSYHPGGYLRETDDMNPPSGFPRLPPKVWLGFLLDEVSLCNPEGILRNALVSLIPRSPLAILTGDHSQ